MARNNARNASAQRYDEGYAAPKDFDDVPGFQGNDFDDYGLFLLFLSFTLTRILIEHTRLLSGVGPYPGEGREGSRAPSVEYARTRQASKGYENESNYGRDREPSVAYNQTMPWNNVENLSDIMRGRLIQIAQRLGNGADAI